MKTPFTYTFSILIAVMMVGTAFSLIKAQKYAEAQTLAPIPFGGQIATVELCCNGLQFTTTGQFQSPAYGTFIMEWAKMIPNPSLGLGLYSWWSIVPTEKVIGTAIAGGVCQTIASECSATTPVTWSVNQMGTTLITSQ